MTGLSEKSLAPLVKEVTVRRGVDEAFSIFTEGIAAWWPLEVHSIGGAKAKTCRVEGRVGGRLYEIHEDGSEAVWGRVVAWSPPGKLAFTWHPGREESTSQTVTVTFAPHGDGARVRLVHEGWERLGEKAAETRGDYDKGWDFVLGERFVAGCA